MAYVDRRVHAFDGLRGSSFKSLLWQMEPFTSLWWNTWIVVYKPLVVCADRRSQALGGRWSHLRAFGGIRGSSCSCLWWHTWIVVCKPLVADGLVNKPLVAYVDRRSQAFCGRWSHLQAFGGIRGSSFTSLWWFAWIAVHKP